MSVRRKNKNKRKVRTVVALSIISLLFISTGYAAISTNITLNAKGNIIKQSSDLSTEDLTKAENVLDSSSTKDGLYKDTTEEAVNGKYRYIYRGADPDNYICLSDEETCDEESMYRIIAIETDGTLKVIKNTVLSKYKEFDIYSCDLSPDVGYNYKKKKKKGNTYEIDNPIYLLVPGGASTDYSNCGYWSRPGTLNTYLNENWYSDLNNGLSATAKTKIETNHIYNVGYLVSDDTDTIVYEKSKEAQSTWSGTVGLINVTDYVLASTNSACTNAHIYYNDSSCYNNSDTHNWLTSSEECWTMTETNTTMAGVDIKGEYVVSTKVDHVRMEIGIVYVRPVFFLSSDIKLSGEGTNTSPYRITE